MLLHRSETPLRRSVVTNYRESPGSAIQVNDDEEERRQARRRTLLQNNSNGTDTTAIDDNETLKRCMEIYNGNKLSRDNAWSLSLIDTLSNLLDRHHKALNNFKVAGTSLEASSKVYGLRVDSIYTDVLRMAAGLNAKKFTEAQLNEDDDAPSGSGGNGDQAGDVDMVNAAGPQADKPQKPKKRTRKAVSTVTKNKDTLNARLDTVPLQDAVFGKLNSVVGSINSSNRLMNNILPSKESELRLRTNYRFWDDSELPAEVDYTIVETNIQFSTDEFVNADWIVRLNKYENYVLRPLHSGYSITDTPNPINRPNDADQNHSDDNEPMGNDDDMGFYQNSKELSMAFDINAECEPMPVDEQPAVLEVDYNELEEMTNDERTALNYCRGLRKDPVIIEDLRPIDANSKLEYSYRPIDNISQFWAGPSHWKFKRIRPRSTTLAPYTSNTQQASSAQRGRRAQALQAKRRSKQLKFGEFHDDLFIRVEDASKLRRANIQKKWDGRKLKLPTNLKIDKMCFFKYEFAPGLKVPYKPNRTFQRHDDDYDDDDCEHIDFVGGGGASNGVDDDGLPSNINDSHPDEFGPHFNEDGVNNGMPANLTEGEPGACQDVNMTACANTESNLFNNTVLEIATEFEGAPSQVTKVIVPFAKRAKVIDMKGLKRSCLKLIHTQLNRSIRTEIIPKHPTIVQEKYADGVASFIEIYEHLPELLTPAMTDALSPAVALYSVLHLANEMNLRLIPQDDREDFLIRQIIDS